MHNAASPGFQKAWDLIVLLQLRDGRSQALTRDSNPSRGKEKNIVWLWKGKIDIVGTSL